MDKCRFLSHIYHEPLEELVPAKPWQYLMNLSTIGIRNMYI